MSLNEESLGVRRVSEEMERARYAAIELIKIYYIECKLQPKIISLHKPSKPLQIAETPANCY